MRKRNQLCGWNSSLVWFLPEVEQCGRWSLDVVTARFGGERLSAASRGCGRDTGNQGHTEEAAGSPGLMHLSVRREWWKELG